MADEDVWKKRYLVYMLVRLGGLAVILLGVAIAYTDLVKPGGSTAVGAIVGILGAIDTLIAPRLLRKQWAEQDAQEK